MNALPFDAVIFDLDGTLVATDSFWVVAADRGARVAFEELGIRRELPTAREWMALVGTPLASGFERLFPDLSGLERERVMARCVEESHAAMRAGGAVEMPGAREVLRELRARGVRLGIASNCAKAYLDSMLRMLKLGELVDEARCLQSPGVAKKADMLADLLETFGTTSAVMVGDRASDGEAARANGLPFVHLASGFAPPGERIECDARIGALAELLPTLERGASWARR